MHITKLRPYLCMHRNQMSNKHVSRIVVRNIHLGLDFRRSHSEALTKGLVTNYGEGGGGLQNGKGGGGM